MGYSPWGHKESDTTGGLTHTHGLMNPPLSCEALESGVGFVCLSICNTCTALHAVISFLNVYLFN